MANPDPIAARNLRLLFPDDRPFAASKHPLMSHLIELVDDARLTWLRHCADMFRNKRISFDMMSADINYSYDTTQPSCEESNAWGLAHALAALARRESMDEELNRLPFVWEVRTISPTIYSENKHVEEIAATLYGLLQSLAFTPESEDDKLVPHLMRKLGSDQAADGEVEAFPTIRQLFLDHLKRQQPEDSDPSAAAYRLVKKWRHAFENAVRNRDVVINITEAKKQADIISQIDKVNDIDNPPFVPIGNMRAGISDAISLYSIFFDVIIEDLEENDCFHLHKKRKEIKINNENASILDWYYEYMWPTRYDKSIVDDFKRILKITIIEKKAGAMADYMKNKWNELNYFEQTLYIISIFIIYIIQNAETIKLEKIADELGFYNHFNQKFLRPLKDTSYELFYIKGGLTAADLKRYLHNAMAGSDPGPLRRGWEGWIRPVLYEQRHELLEKLAPGLAKSSPARLAGIFED